MVSLASPSNPDDFSRLSFDFLVIGGGTAGLAVASRLAEAEPCFTVGVIEAGQVANADEEIDIPAHYGSTIGGRRDWQFETAPQPGLGGRSLPWPRGKVLGGTSALNFMTWNRASNEDYDAWEALGNAGWGWDGLLPFFKKSETFHPPSEDLKAKVNVSHNPDHFGRSGPIQISYSTDYSPSHSLWHRTLNGLKVKTNPSHLSGSNVGVWTNINTVDPRTASRSYSVSYCSSSARNLHILTGATVEEIVIQQDDHGFLSATGVRFMSADKEYMATASREVILSAGSVQSPQILELSGIGSSKVLAEARIAVKVDNANVGENLQDHLMLAMIFEVDSNVSSPDDLKKDASIAAAAREQYYRDRTGPLTILPCSIAYVPLAHFIPHQTLDSLYSKAKQLPSEKPRTRDIRAARLDGNAHLGQIEYIFDIGNWNPFFDGDDDKKYGTLLQILQYPFSIGSIHVSPRRDDNDDKDGKPFINPQYYGGEHGAIDAEVMRECVRFAEGITKTAPLADIIRAPASPSRADLADNDSLKNWIVQNTITDWHPVGTCAMGGHQGISGGVVDERLQVYGVKGLRVIDASIMPLQISAHLQATVYAIAEKGASMILEDHS